MGCKVDVALSRKFSAPHGIKRSQNVLQVNSMLEVPNHHAEFGEAGTPLPAGV